MQPVATVVTRSFVCMSVCLPVCLLGTWVSCAETGWTDKDVFGGWLMWVQGSMYQIGVHILPWEWAFVRVTCVNRSNVTTRGECDCPAHVADKCIFHHERWQECGVASCQIALDTCYYYYYLFLLQTVLGWMSYVSIGCVLGYVICFAIGLGTWRSRCDHPTPVYIGLCVICYATLILKT